MTALQDWLNLRPTDPFGLKQLICGVVKIRDTDTTAEQEKNPVKSPDVTLMSRGLERC